MDLIKLIKIYLTENDQKIPWDYGLKSQASKRAIAAWSMLDVAKRLMISIHNPYKDERNKAIYNLNRKGITQEIISEISGISVSTVDRAIYK